MILVITLALVALISGPSVSNALLVVKTFRDCVSIDDSPPPSLEEGESIGVYLPEPCYTFGSNVSIAVSCSDKTIQRFNTSESCQGSPSSTHNLETECFRASGGINSGLLRFACKEIDDTELVRIRLFADENCTVATKYPTTYNRLNRCFQAGDLNYTYDKANSMTMRVRLFNTSTCAPGTVISETFAAVDGTCRSEEIHEFVRTSDLNSAAGESLAMAPHSFARGVGAIFILLFLSL